MNQNRELLDIIAAAAADKKALEIEAIDVSGLTSVADCFMICTGTSAPHLKAICDAIEQAAEQKLSISARHIEGYNQGDWILIDYGEIIVHIFLAEMRRFYSLECLWNTAKKIDLSHIIGKIEAGV